VPPYFPTTAWLPRPLRTDPDAGATQAQLTGVHVPPSSTSRGSVPGERADTGEDEVTEFPVTIDDGVELFGP
jgi:hypothetical protein